jgi:transcriptional regulator with XRE-family HTH domain
MVNNTKFAERLKKVLDYYHISAAAFADEINVQRSSISHLLSGRNRPSLDFVLKVLDTYDTVDLYWLMNGKGSFPKKQSSTAPTSANIEKIQNIDQTVESFPEKEIERIVIFYKDGSFENYNP